MCRIWTQWHLFHYQFVYICAVHAQSRSGCSLYNTNATCTTAVFMAIHNCEIIYVYCVTYGNFMPLLCRMCVGCANFVNKLTVKCNFVYTLLPYVLHLNSTDCIQFRNVHVLHKHTRGGYEVDVIASTYPLTTEFHHQ